MSETGWGQLAPYENYGRVGDRTEDFLVISYEEATSEKYATHKHASHTMLLARDPKVLWNLYPARAAILMQMRFDGVIGFPGGLVDPGENPVEAANREMVEETLGLIRPPLYTMGDNYRGLPAFLANGFAGNARDELLEGLQHFKTHTAEEIQVALTAQK